MSSEYIELPQPKPLKPPRTPLEVLRDFWVQHQKRALLYGYGSMGEEVRCDCPLCPEAAQLLGVGR